MNFASKKVFFPDKSEVIKQPFCFSRMRTSQNFDFLICESISIFFCRSPFFLCLSSLLAVFCPFYRLVFWLGIVAGQLLRKGTNLIFKEQSGKQRNWQWIVPQNVTFFVSVALLGLVRISKTRYRWKSLLTLLLTKLST